jgi:cytochrome c peroxidase
VAEAAARFRFVLGQIAGMLRFDRPTLKMERAIAVVAGVFLTATVLANAGTSARGRGGDSAGAISSEAALGKKIFFDASLSASGRMSCATCHSPAYAYGPPNGLAVQLGGAAMNQQGARSVPSLRYVLNRTPVWHMHYVEDPLDKIEERNDPPTGGFGWDGRFQSLREQAAFPLLAPNEMANAGPGAVSAKLERATYAEDFRAVFGARIFAEPAEAYAQALAALERFELEDPSFHPYSSKYDAYLDGNAQLSEQERRGLALFDDPLRGNCASCHLDQKGADGSHPLFTDYEFEALGVPRNPEIAANRSKQYFDMGLCGPLRGDQSKVTTYCGLFKTPTLRNVATRAAFFHNGRFHSLRDSLRFYVERDTDAGRWYPVSAGGVEKFDDLPRGLRRNIDVIDEPLTRKEGEAPAWSETEIEDVIAFLKTLTDRDVESTGGEKR